jgi:metallo-beta-lactamase family protein
MRITIHGAARNVTGSKHLITLNNGTQLLLDCGMFQGMGEDTDELNEYFGFNPLKVSHLILSHAHIDHCGLIPRLVAEGFRGNILCTDPTIGLAKLLLMDSAKIQEQDVEYSNKKRRNHNQPLLKPLYTEDDVIESLRLFKIVNYHEDYEVCQGVTLRFTDAGHIIGSAAVHLSIVENAKTTHITFSGDVGRYGDMILKNPQTFPQADHIIMESTYGDSLHKDLEPIETLLQEIIHQTCILRKGKVIIPAFSVGRTQEILYALNALDLKGTLPDVPYYVDSPLSEKVTMLLKSFPHEYNKNVKEVLKVDSDPFQLRDLSL